MATEQEAPEKQEDYSHQKLETTNISIEDMETGILPDKEQEDKDDGADGGTEKKEPINDEGLDNKKPLDTDIDKKQVEYSDEKVLEFLKSKGIEASDFESLKPKEAKEINPYEDLLDEEDRAYLNFKKETGKKISRKDYNEIVTKDYSKVSAYDLAKEKVVRDSGISLSDSEVREYLEEELGFDPNGEELTARERIKLASFVKDIRESKIAQQKEILDRLPDLKSVEKEYDSKDYIKLENGTITKKADYEAAVERRNNFLKANKEAVSRATDFDLNITVDENGKERQLSYTHKLEPKDLQRLESITNDVFTHFENTFKKDGNYDVESLNRNMAWADEQLRGKMLDSLAHQIRANAIEEIMKEGDNINLESRKQLDRQTNRGVKYIPISDI